MIGKAWLLKGYHESEDANPDFPQHIEIVDVFADYGIHWGCECNHTLEDGTETNWTWTLGVPKRYIEFIPPYMLSPDVIEQDF